MEATPSLSKEQLDRLEDSIVEHAYMDHKFLRGICRTYAEKFDEDEYKQWFGATDDEGG